MCGRRSCSWMYARSSAPDSVAAAAKRSGSRNAHFIAPYPPMDRPATYVSSRRPEIRKNCFAFSGSSAERKSQKRIP